MKKRIHLPVLALAVFLALGGCVEKVPLSVTNGLEDCDINCIYISRSTDDIWGTNHLPESEVLPPGKTAEVLVRPGLYDIQVVDELGDTYTLSNISVERKPFNWTVTPQDLDKISSTIPSPVRNAGSCQVVITNRLKDGEIHGIWISPSSDEEWGDNYLGSETLFTGDTYTAYLRPGTYDLCLMDENGTECTHMQVTVDAGGYSWSVTSRDFH